MTKSRAASIRARLLNHARDTKQSFDLVLTRYCLERLLYRISISNHANQFYLKGAMLFDLWFNLPHRPTRDVDFLGFGPATLTSTESTFRDVSNIDVDDGVEFLPDTVHATEIRQEANYNGIRITLIAILDNARCKIQADIGFGDAVTPGPIQLTYPTLLQDLEAPKLLTYPIYTVVAEKFEALAKLGIANSRMKDYFDLWILAVYADFDGETLRQAIIATFGRRQTKLTTLPPLGLTMTFAQDFQKQTQWQAFVRKNRLEAPPLNDVVNSLSDFLMPIVAETSNNAPVELFWRAGGPWSAVKANQQAD